MIESEIFRDAKRLFEYLYIRDDDCCRADLIVGFGHFDLCIPRHCAHLYEKGFAPKILFTGGRGSGSADLAEAEAEVFANVIAAEYPKIPSCDIIVEGCSTNTGENISMSATVLRESKGAKDFDNGIGTIIAVACAYRQRRVWRTLQKQLPGIKTYNMPPKTTFEKEMLAFQKRGEDLIQLLLGEVERIMRYPEKGFMAHEHLSVQIMESYERLKQKCDE